MVSRSRASFEIDNKRSVSILITLFPDLPAKFVLQNVTSPNYPNAYPNNLSIVWKITAYLGEYLEIQIDDFDFETGHDFLYIVEGKSSSSNANRDYPELIKYWVSRLILGYK